MKKMSKEMFLMVMSLSCLAFAVGGGLLGRMHIERQNRKYLEENVYMINDSTAHINLSEVSCAMLTLHESTSKLVIETNNVKNIEIYNRDKLVFTTEDRVHREFNLKYLFPGKETSSIGITFTHQH